ncbi:peroxisome biogenesis factor 2 [Planococcus citri]|uniref:peroxisome biogenesis factor 2 n=1 Tax=Planococcus citri TaxID=170843 RepID=UPI0031F7FE2F
MEMKQQSRTVLFPARVTMLDATALDQEVFNIMKSQLQTIFRIVPPWIISKHELKVDLILKFVIWKLSVTKFRGTFGQQLLNMKFRDNDLSESKKYAILVSQIITYLQSNNFFVFPSQKANEVVEKADIIIRLCSLVNLFWFFGEGKYPTLIDRVLGLRPVCIVNKPRSIGYNYMTRELLWHGFIELLTFTLSVVNYQYIRRKFNRLFHKASKQFSDQKPNLRYTVRTKCSICNKSPILPHYLGCTHVACYYCIKANKLVDTNFECPSCGYFQQDTSFVKLSS